MLAVARGVLMRVHHGVFEALAAPPVQAPDGTLVYGNWDVRHVLRQARRQVQCRAWLWWPTRGLSTNLVRYPAEYPDGSERALCTVCNPVRF